VQALNYGILLLQIITLSVIGWLIKSYFPSYFSEKGKNLATKEDIGYITTEVERIRLLYATDLERVKSELQEKIQLVAHQLSLTLESSKHYQNLRTQAYVDFIKGAAGVAMAQQHKDLPKELEFLILLTDAKARIAVYGSNDVLLHLGLFFEKYGALTSEKSMRVFLEAIQKMREETILMSDHHCKRSISQLLFSQNLSHESEPTSL